MKTLKRLIPNDFLRYCVVGIALFALFLLGSAVGGPLGRQLYFLTH